MDSRNLNIKIYSSNKRNYNKKILLIIVVITLISGLEVNQLKTEAAKTLTSLSSTILFLWLFEYIYRLRKWKKELLTIEKLDLGTFIKGFNMHIAILISLNVLNYGCSLFSPFAQYVSSWLILIYATFCVFDPFNFFNFTSMSQGSKKYYIFDIFGSLLVFDTMEQRDTYLRKA